jgi:hypothetical protein
MLVEVSGRKPVGRDGMEGPVREESLTFQDVNLKFGIAGPEGIHAAG